MKRKSPKTKPVLRAFARCPVCGSAELKAAANEQFCLSCDWDSILMSVERGDLDDMIYDYEVKLQRDQQRQVASTTDKSVVIKSNQTTIDGSAA